MLNLTFVIEGKVSDLIKKSNMGTNLNWPCHMLLVQNFGPPPKERAINGHLENVIYSLTGGPQYLRSGDSVGLQLQP